MQFYFLFLKKIMDERCEILICPLIDKSINMCEYAEFDERTKRSDLQNIPNNISIESMLDTRNEPAISR